MAWFIGIHAFLGEISALAFLWVFVEFLKPHRDEFGMCQKAAWVGVVASILSWLVGGYYYVVHYGPHVKPIVKASSMPWAHLVFMELKGGSDKPIILN